ncbi:MAG: GlsB/YeaQ/YmgE family stress response membrane protein [Stappia sp.]|uniref:GlsB/YeaQ/YmgE family stress response membrane protein n=1 Tax=Stappia sp. TaxID=1870903 RepID=UPI000C40920C|nr:GlsB/YeaQ/YmgE family stress response membrane protein [Stappia sp.]MAB00812.1 GlsB/YeaQ/YmgE family stress response membrane protein [Stappia sp.]MBM22564.1 GlsB/YeaQ/YmgE family stress response membrane protein [Stappia sp.]|tara:strand:- start:982 stop:1221 length:240 start_codon:yes stop_codon:yes gene_type:complete
MGFILWIVIGLIAGAVAHRVLDSRGGFLGSLIVGLVGALVGGYLADILRLHVTGGFIDQLLVSTLGAILFLFIWRKIRS